MQKFKQGSKVCFFGDSITDNGLWVRRVYDYYLSTAKIKCEMYNLGVSGNDSRRAFSRIEQIYKLNATDVVIMFGMNDVACLEFSVKPLTYEKISDRRKFRDTNFNYYKKICENLRKKNIRIHFCTPTPYDEISDVKDENLIGTFGALREFANRVLLLAKEYNCDVIDFNTMLYDAQRVAYKKGKSYIGDDRTHPNPVGYELMARYFLSEQGFPIEFSTDYDTLKKQSTLPYSEWENKRFELEKIGKSTFYTRYEYFWSIKSEKERIEKVKTALETHEAASWAKGDTLKYVETEFKNYLEGYDLEESRFLNYVNFVKTANN